MCLFQSPDGYSKNEDSYPGQPAKMEVKLNPSKSSLVDGLHKYKSQPNKDFARERNIVTVYVCALFDFVDMLLTLCKNL